jgi:hypothetical protein
MTSPIWQKSITKIGFTSLGVMGYGILRELRRELYIDTYNFDDRMRRAVGYKYWFADGVACATVLS